MGIQLPTRPYLTYSELLSKWQCTENDLSYAVISGALKPALRFSQALPMVNWYDSPLYGITPSDHEQYRKDSKGFKLEITHKNWLFLQLPKQISAFDCEFTVCTDDVEADLPADIEDIPFALWYYLPVPIRIKEIKEEAVFLLTEIAKFEINPHIEESSSKKTGTRDSTYLNMIAGLLEFVKNPRPGRETEEKIIAELVANYSDAMGISKSNLEKYFKLADKATSFL